MRQILTRWIVEITNIFNKSAVDHLTSPQGVEALNLILSIMELELRTNKYEIISRSTILGSENKNHDDKSSGC